MSCYFKECGRPIQAKGLCASHYAQQWRGQPLKPLRRSPRKSSGEGYIDVRGYVVMKRNGRKAYEHTFIMEDLLGRQLLPGENVHHKNGVRHDNRPENLELWASYQPSGQRAVDLVDWAREILNRYDSVVL
jgi:hypothetical protein